MRGSAYTIPFLGGMYVKFHASLQQGRWDILEV